MTPRERITDPSQIPSGMTEEQARNFWDDHEVTDLYLRKAGPVPGKLLPKVRTRTKSTPALLNEDTFDGLKKLVSIGRQNTLGLPWISEDHHKSGLRDLSDEMSHSLHPFKIQSQPSRRKIANSRRPASTTVELLSTLQKAVRS